MRPWLKLLQGILKPLFNLNLCSYFTSLSAVWWIDMWFLCLTSDCLWFCVRELKMRPIQGILKPVFNLNLYPYFISFLVFDGLTCDFYAWHVIFLLDFISHFVLFFCIYFPLNFDWHLTPKNLDWIFFLVLFFICVFSVRVHHTEWLTDFYFLCTLNTIKWTIYCVTVLEHIFYDV